MFVAPIFCRAFTACQISGALTVGCRQLIGIGLLLILPVGCIQAEATKFCASFCGARDQLQDTVMTPIRQLEGDALFQSAAAMRERVMTSEQRLLNQFWLNDTAATRIQGGRVWSRLLRHSLKQIRTQTAIQETDEDPLDYDSFGNNNSDYQLRLSNDNVRLVFHYSF